MAENPQPDFGVGVLTYPGSPSTSASQCARLQTLLVQARPRSSTCFSLGGWGGCCIAHPEAFHMGGPVFMNVNSHVGKLTCVGQVTCTTMTCERDYRQGLGEASSMAGKPSVMSLLRRAPGSARPPDLQAGEDLLL